MSLLAIKQGAVDTSRLDTAVAAAALPTLTALYAAGVLTAGAASAPVAALVLHAKTAGAIGNAIEVALSDVKPASTPADTTVDAAVRTRDHRGGLTVASIGTELGSPTGATRPGLVTLTAPAAELPGTMAATALTAAAPGDPRRVAVPSEDGSGTAFTLEAAAAVPAAAALTAAIADVDTTTGSFTLTITYDHAAGDVALDDLDATFGLLLDVAPGPGGYAPPAAGTVTLTGGSDAATTAPVLAKATVLSS